MQEYNINIHLTSLSHYLACYRVRPQVFHPCCWRKKHEKACQCSDHFIYYKRTYLKKASSRKRKEKKRKDLSSRLSPIKQINEVITTPYVKKSHFIPFTIYHTKRTQYYMDLQSIHLQRTNTHCLSSTTEVNQILISIII